MLKRTISAIAVMVFVLTLCRLGTALALRPVETAQATGVGNGVREELKATAAPAAGNGEAAAIGGGIRKLLAGLTGSGKKANVTASTAEQATVVSVINKGIPHLPATPVGDKKADRNQAEQELKDFLIASEIGTCFTVEALRAAFPEGNNPAKAWTETTLVGCGFEQQGDIYMKIRQPEKFTPPVVRNELTDQQRSAIYDAMDAANGQLSASKIDSISDAYFVVSNLTAGLAKAAMAVKKEVREAVFNQALETQKTAWLDKTAVLGRSLTDQQRQILTEAFDGVKVVWPQKGQTSVAITLFEKQFTTKEVATAEFTGFIRLNCVLNLANENPSVLTPTVASGLYEDVQNGRISVENLRQLDGILSGANFANGNYTTLHDEIRTILHSQNVNFVVDLFVNHPDDRDNYLTSIARLPTIYSGVALTAIRDNEGMQPYIKQDPEGFLVVCDRLKVPANARNRKYAQGCIDVLAGNTATYETPQPVYDYLEGDVFPYVDTVRVGSRDFTPPEQSEPRFREAIREAGQDGKYKIDMRCSVSRDSGLTVATVEITRGDEIPVPVMSDAEALQSGQTIRNKSRNEVLTIVTAYAELLGITTFYCDFYRAQGDQYAEIRGSHRVNEKVGDILTRHSDVIAWNIVKQRDSNDLLIVPAAASAAGADEVVANIGQLLKGPFDVQHLRRLDESIDDLLSLYPDACAAQLKEGDKAVAAAIIERLALPAVAQKEDGRGMLTRFLAAAATNPDIAHKAKAVEEMVAQGVSFRPFALPAPGTLIAADRAAEPKPGFTFYNAADDAEIAGRINENGKLMDVTKPSRVAILEQHPNANQFFMVTEGQLIMLVAPLGSMNLEAYVLNPGDIVAINPNVYHIAVNATENVKFMVYNEDPNAPGVVVKPETTITSIGVEFSLTASDNAKATGLGITYTGDNLDDLIAAAERLRATLPTIKIADKDYADVRTLTANTKVLILADAGRRDAAEAKKAEILTSEGIGLRSVNIRIATSRTEADDAVAEMDGFDYVVRIGRISFDLTGITLPSIFVDTTREDTNLRQKIEDATLASSV